jgi:predicted ribosome quality control (RQC) complex YloA/Tae2 family protein|tara:strand:+ start:1774 stop:2172 length:399 start_codon:yes stop_codon:yes gene_type:complete
MVNFRAFVTSSGLRVFGGRDAENNDKLVWDGKPNDVMLHTSAPGSPFVNVGDSATKSDIKEAAVFCAKFSQDWRDSKRDVVVNVFVRKDMDKDKKAKSGSWNVSKQDKIKVKAVDVLKYEKVLRSGGISLGE